MQDVGCGMPSRHENRQCDASCSMDDSAQMRSKALTCRAVSSSLIHCGVLHTVTFAPLAACGLQTPAHDICEQQPFVCEANGLSCIPGCHLTMMCAGRLYTFDDPNPDPTTASLTVLDAFADTAKPG